MNIFIISLVVIGLGGTLPFLCCNNVGVARKVYVGTTLFGCGAGLIALFILPDQVQMLKLTVPWLHVFSLSFNVDSLSLFFLIPIFLLYPLAVIYSSGYFKTNRDGLRLAVHYFCANLLVIAMALVTLAANIVTFAMMWELMSLSSYILVMFDYEKATTRTAGYLYLLFTQAGALLIFAAFGLAYSHTGNLSFALFSTIPENIKLVVFFLAFLGFASKAGAFPLHIWLPHAHPAAPSHISAMMSGVMIKMGIFGIFRIYSLLASNALIIGQVVLVFGMVSGVLGVLYALGKHNLKKLLAYHSVENIGIILIGAGLGMIGLAKGNTLMAGFGFAGALLHVLNHSIFKSLLFFGAGGVIKQTGMSEGDRLGGLMKRMPFTGRSFLVGAVSISGLPPFNGFVSEFLIYFSAFCGLRHNHGTLLLVILAIISLTVIGGLATFCFTKVVGIVFLGEPRTMQATHAEEGDRNMTMPMVILALLCLAIGIFPQSFIHLAFAGFADVIQFPLDRVMIDTVGNNLAFGSRLFLLIFLVFFYLRKLMYRGKEISKGSTWGCGFTKPTARIQYTGTSYARSIIDFFKPFAIVHETKVYLQEVFPGKTEFTNHVDDIAEVGMRHGFVSPLLSVLGSFRWIQHGNVQLYIGYIIVAIGVILLASFI